MQAVEILFGRSVAGRIIVGEREWARFLAREITPRFSDGLSVVDAAGQFKTPDGIVAHEPSKLVIIIATAAFAARFVVIIVIVTGLGAA